MRLGGGDSGGEGGNPNGQGNPYAGGRRPGGGEPSWSEHDDEIFRGFRMSLCSLGVAPVVILSIVLAFAGFGSVEITEYGLLENFVTRSVQEKPFQSGRYWVGPWNRFIKFPAVVKTIQFSDDKLQADLEMDEQGDPMLRSRTSDGLDVSIELSFQYQLNSTFLFALYTTLGAATDFHQTFVRVAIDRLTEIATLYTANEFFVERTRIGKDMEQKLRKDFQGELFSTVFSFQLRSVQLPAEFEKAIQRTEVQKQDLHVAKAEQQSTNVSLQTKLMQANRRVKIRKNRGEAYSQSKMLANAADVKQYIAAQEKIADSYSGVLKALDSKEDNFLAYVQARALRDHRSDKTTLGLSLPNLRSLAN